MLRYDVHHKRIHACFEIFEARLQTLYIQVLQGGYESPQVRGGETTENFFHNLFQVLDFLRVVFVGICGGHASEPFVKDHARDHIRGENGKQWIQLHRYPNLRSYGPYHVQNFFTSYKVTCCKSLRTGEAWNEDFP